MHEDSGLGNVVSNLKRICIGANVLDSIAIYGHNEAMWRND